ncbi:MAG: hypothetical protein AAF539_15195, partial [Planctomycetota bacterium]
LKLHNAQLLHSRRWQVRPVELGEKFVGAVAVGTSIAISNELRISLQSFADAVKATDNVSFHTDG